MILLVRRSTVLAVLPRWTLWAILDPGPLAGGGIPSIKMGRKGGVAAKFGPGMGTLFCSVLFELNDQKGNGEFERIQLETFLMEMEMIWVPSIVLSGDW